MYFHGLKRDGSRKRLALAPSYVIYRDPEWFWREPVLEKSLLEVNVFQLLILVGVAVPELTIFSNSFQVLPF